MGLPLYEGVDWNKNFLKSDKAVLRLPLYEGVDWNTNFFCEWCKTLNVSLFTREWIEIVVATAKTIKAACLPLYEGVDWNFQRATLSCSLLCLPLYEGVDWNRKRTNRNRRGSVSLFTREWIEIIRCPNLGKCSMSPSLRGSGLKCIQTKEQAGFARSPSLRGSGLKWSGADWYTRLECLPLYEGVDWNHQILCLWQQHLCLPLYEGVDWNFFGKKKSVEWKGLPLYEGVDWNSCDVFFLACKPGLPLYEGVDWNPTYQWMTEKPVLSPSLRGSGLKWWCVLPLFCCVSVSLFTREWIEMAENKHFLVTIWKSPSLRGSGLKFLLQFLVSLFEQSPSLRGSGLK